MERIPEFVGNHLFLVSLLVAILMLLAWNLMGTATAGARQVTSSELTQLVNRSHAIVVDVRDKEEYDNGHITGAINIPMQDLERRVDELKKYRNKPVIAYCNNGAQSNRAARQLAGTGFETVHNLGGGLRSWQSERLPLVKD